MKKNRSHLSVGSPFPEGQSYLAGKSKKMQGYDATNVSSTNFTSKIESLKNKPRKECLQDQYIKGLQDQMNYLQMELKLLHEKEQSRHGQIDQLEKFFGDGISINENILAIKNGFSNYKTTFEKKIFDLKQEKHEREELIQGLQKRDVEIMKQISREEKQNKDLETQNINKICELAKQQAKLKKHIERDEEITKRFRQENRQLQEKINGINRNKEIQIIKFIKAENHKFTKLHKLRESITEKEKEFQELQKQYQDMQKQEEEQTYVIKMEQDNLDLKKKAISMDKELSSLLTKGEEKRMELDLKLKDRHKEIVSKMEIKNRVDNEKSRLEKENCMTVEEVEKNAKEREIQTLEKIVEKNKKLSKYIAHYSDLLSNLQNQVQEMVEKKPQIRNEITSFTAEVNRLAQLQDEEKEREADMFSDQVKTQMKIEHLQGIVPPVIEHIKKSSDKINQFKTEKEHLISDITVKEKQIELIRILKSLNLEEVEMSKASGHNIQAKINNFIRSWETLQRAR